MEGRTRRDRLESRLERAIRKNLPEDIAEREAELWCPPFPEAASNIWTVWQRIRRRKGIGQHGHDPLEWPDIDAFLRLTKTALTPEDIQLLEDVDDAFLAQSVKQASKSEQQEALKDRVKAIGKSR